LLLLLFEVVMRSAILVALSAVGLISGAHAADIYTPSAGPGSFKDAPAPYVNWGGFYLGAHVGGAWGNVDVKDTTGGVPYGPFSFDSSGVFGGGTAGYNIQRGNIVFGVEGDIGYMDLSGHRTIPSSTPPYLQDQTLDGGLYGDITGRLGYAFDRTLVYAKGGFAFYDGEGKQVTQKPGYTPTGTDTFTGWTIGGGLEHFISPAWSLKVEYLHFDFGNKGGAQTSVTDLPVGYVYKNTFDVTADSVKVGLNYHVGSGYEPLK
jgi:outer membrane immunogenic protein